MDQNGNSQQIKEFTAYLKQVSEHGIYSLTLSKMFIHP